MLIDAYEAGARKDQINHKDIRVVKVYDYSSTYGVVLAGNSTKLLKCSHGYMQANKAKMFELIAKNAEVVEVRRISGEKRLGSDTNITIFLRIFRTFGDI